METEKYKIGYVRCMLFADFGIEPVRALQFINDMEKRPDKVARYKELVVKSLSLQYEGLKDWSKDKLAELAKQRAKAWRKQMGDIAIPEYLAMSKQWNIPLDRFIDIKLTPEFIKKMLDCYIIGQEDYKIMLSVSFYSYLLQKRSRSILPKSNLLVCGPSGSGKTYGMHILSNLFQVPFVIIHCNSIVQEGIEGSKITDGLTSLLLKGWEKEDIKHAVVCFDEFDKLFEKRKFGIDSGEYNSRIVNEMLNIIDDKGEVEFQTSYERRSDRVKLPTSKMMFVFTGVFDGLRKKDSESKDMENLPKAKRRIGFGAQIEAKAAENKLVIDEKPTTEDFIKFGVKPEILGRIQNFVYLDALTEEDMIRVFSLDESSPLTEFKRYFASNDIDVELTEEGKHTLAKLAHERKLGVRGLRSILHQALLEDMYDLEVGEDHILRITKQYIMDNLKQKNK